MKPFAIIQPQPIPQKYKTVSIKHIQQINPEVVIVQKCAPIQKLQFREKYHVVERGRVQGRREVHVVDRARKEGDMGMDMGKEMGRGDSAGSSLVQSLQHHQFHRVPIFNPNPQNRHTLPTPQTQPQPQPQPQPIPQLQPQSPHQSHLSQRSNQSQQSRLSSQWIANSIHDTPIANVQQQPPHPQTSSERSLITQCRSSFQQRPPVSVKSGRTGKSYGIDHKDQEILAQSVYIPQSINQSRYTINAQPTHRQDIQLQPQQQSIHKLKQQQPNTSQKQPHSSPSPSPSPVHQLNPPQPQPQGYEQTVTYQPQPQNPNPQQNRPIQPESHPMQAGQAGENVRVNKVPIFSKKNKVYHAGVTTSIDQAQMQQDNLNNSMRASRNLHKFKIFAYPHPIQHEQPNSNKLKLESHVNQYQFENKQPITQTRRKSTSQISLSQKSLPPQQLIQPQAQTLKKQPPILTNTNPNHNVSKNSSQISQINPNSNSQHFLQNFDGSFYEGQRSSAFSPQQVYREGSGSIQSVNAISCDQDNSYVIRYEEKPRHFKKIVGLGRRSRRLDGQQMARCVTEKADIGAKLSDKESAQQPVQQLPKPPKILKIKSKKLQTLNNPSVHSLQSHQSNQSHSSQISIQILKITQLKPLKI